MLASIPHTVALLGPLAPFGIVFFAVFVGLGYSRLKNQRDELRFGWWLFFAHLACIAIVCVGNVAGLDGYDSPLFSRFAYLVWRGVLLVGIALLALACVPLSTWTATLRLTKRLWLYAALAGVLAWIMRYPLQSMWDASSSAPGRVLQVLTFHSVKAVLSFFRGDVVVDQEAFLIGTPRFAVIIAEACSGMEGLGLVLVFTVVWLWYFRKESRFPQALLLVPCALVCVWTLNILRIALLVVIGDAGGRDVAMVGFHSQAGWIAFTSVAFAFSMATRKLSWVRRWPNYEPVEAAEPGIYVKGDLGGEAVPGAVQGSPVQVSAVQVEPAGVVPVRVVPGEVRPAEAESVGESAATGAFLVPFLAILGASFVSKAASAYFEWLYPLRFFAAAMALWIYRKELKKLDWRCGWLAPVVGAAVFLIWIVPTFWARDLGSSVLGSSLAALAPGQRVTWIAFRVAAAVLTVPIAEELAFRGYLARRLMDREFDLIPFTALTVLSIGISSVAFGVMHGQHWIVGVVAGVGFALVARWRGRFGDAFVAHATSNLLLAVWVLVRGDFGQW